MLNLRVDSILATSPTLCPIPEQELFMKLTALPISIFLLTTPLLSNVWISMRMNTRKINLARIMKLAASSRASAVVWYHTLSLSRPRNMFQNALIGEIQECEVSQVLKESLARCRYVALC